MATLEKKIKILRFLKRFQYIIFFTGIFFSFLHQLKFLKI